MEFRADPRDFTGTLVTVDEFSDMVRAGTVEPTALYREPWTQGEWRSVTDLPLFHRLSPTRHPLGPRLLGRQREREAFQQHLLLYDQSSFLERQLGVTPLEQFARDSGAQMASRLVILPSFFPESIASIAFQKDALIVSSVEAPSSLWRSRGPLTPDLPPFDHNACVRHVATVPAHLAPAPMRSAAELVTALLNCPSAYTPALDGVGFRHQYFDGEHHPEVEWSNPNPDDHASQLEVLAGYRTLLRRGEPAPR